jgi:TonB family protein
MTRMPGRFLVLWMLPLLTVQVALTALALQDSPKKYRALLPESIARKSAITKIMPIYPEEAVQSGVSGIVHIKLEISPGGEVLGVKIKPRTDALLSKAVSDAVKQWKFRPWVGLDGLPEGVITRLIFRFSLNGEQPQVELYSPEPDTRTDECLECSNSAREMREWREWKEVSKGGDKP